MGQLSMGQRLNIEIHKNGNLLANCYFHWSGYTNSALNLTKEIVDKIHDVPQETSNDLDYAVTLLCATGAGISEDGTRDLLSPYLYPKAKDRNLGLISCMPEKMEDTRIYEEGRVEIDIGTKTIQFNVWQSLSPEDFDDIFAEEELPKNLTKDIPDPHVLSFDTFYDFYENLMIDSDYYLESPDGYHFLLPIE